MCSTSRFLDTDMGNKGAKHLGLEKPPHDPVTNARAIVELVSDPSTR